MCGLRIADVGTYAAELRRVWHSPTHHRKFAFVVLLSDDRRDLIGKDRGERWQIPGRISRHLK
jgi:hypothetical protein